MNQRNRNFILGTIVTFSGCFFASQRVLGQTIWEGSTDSLYRTIRHMDSVMFDAFNSHDISVLQSVFAPNIEFYHDKGGVQDYQMMMESFKNVFRSTPGLRRQLLAGTLTIYPVPGYGAIEMGEHRFTHPEDGKEIIGQYKFVHIWQYKDHSWKVTRVVSVGH